MDTVKLEDKLTDYLEIVRDLKKPTIKKYVNTVNIFCDNIKTVGDFCQFIQDIPFEDFAKVVEESGKSDATKLNYYKAFKSIGKAYVYPKEDWGDLKEMGENHLLCTYLEGTEDFIKNCDKNFEILNKKVKKRLANNEKSESQEKNMIPWKIIEEKAKEAISETKKVGETPNENERIRNKELKILQEAVLASLYGGQSWHMDDNEKVINPPRRGDLLGHTDDDGYMIGTVWSDLLENPNDESSNVLERNVDKGNTPYYIFHLYHHKSVAVHGKYEFVIQDNETVRNIDRLRVWNYSANPNCIYPFIQIREDFDMPRTTNNLIRTLNKIFNHNGRLISIDILRCCYKTDISQKLHEKVRKDNEAMGHTDKVGKTYVKK